METHLVRVGYCEFEEPIDLDPVELECMECGCKFTAEVTDIYDYCPECGSNDIELGE